MKNCQNGRAVERERVGFARLAKDLQATEVCLERVE